MLRLSLLALLLSCAGKYMPLAQTTAIVTEKLTSPGFDTLQLKAYLADPEYQYQRRAPESSWFSRLWRDVVDYIERLFSEGAGMSERILAILLIGGAMIVLAYFFLRSRFGNIFSRGERRIGASTRILNEDVPSRSLAEKIHRALNSGDYRTAYRWTYLDLLRTLGHAGLIRLHGDKTNRDYKHEMSASLLQPDFLLLADAFDYTWYGDYPIDRKTFDQYTTVIGTLIRQISVK
ncbi:MAG TPA: DUF4129 domain-containing protein [Saprospiraceae bacterium]|nr:DUF4129 domain-containing protein [Saprospiraceae bacterium]